MKTSVIAKNIYGGEAEVQVQDLKLRVGVYGLIIQDGKILLTPWREGWDFPGGGMDIDETVSEALIREVREETGLMVKQGELITVRSGFYYATSVKKPTNSVGIYYLCSEPKGELSTDGFTELEKKLSGMPKWFDIEEAKKLTFFNTLTNGKDMIILAQKMLED